MESDHATPSDQAQGRLDRIKDHAKDRLGEARDEITREFSEREAELRDDIAKRVDKVSGALHSAAEDINERTAAKAAHYTARNVGQASALLRDQDLGDVARDLGRFARANPASFIAGATLLGFAAARFVMAGSRIHNDLPGGSHVRRP